MRKSPIADCHEQGIAGTAAIVSTTVAIESTAEACDGDAALALPSSAS